MFLFTTPSPSASPKPEPALPTGQPVVDAIRQGAQQSGVSFDYLLNTAKRESALDPAAKAPTSSATGLFQFIEQTWLGLVKTEGGKVGLQDAASAVSARGDGGYAVSDPAARQAILKLREDPQIASRLAGALTQQNRDALVASTGREPSAGELYMAHMLGARGASDLISAASDNPTQPASAVFPDAARANRPIFFDRSGRPRSTSEVYTVLAAGATATDAVVRPASPAAPGGATAAAASEAPLPSGLGGLFQTGGRPGPISDAVAKIWRVNNEGGRARVSSATPFFPRSGEAPAADPAATNAALAPVAADAAAQAQPQAPVQAAPAGPADSAAPLNPPLPPARPRGIAGQDAGRRVRLATEAAQRLVSGARP